MNISACKDCNFNNDKMKNFRYILKPASAYISHKIMRKVPLSG